ncbi:MAG: ABC transporter ATP-binding protein [Acidobacteriota bacterium]
MSDGTDQGPEHFLGFEGLRRGFGRLEVLRDVSGHAAAGEVLLVTGPNGCGKSTLLRCLAGLVRPQRGTIDCRVDRRDLDTAARRRALGFLSPDLELWGELTTFENLEFVGRLRRVGPERGAELLDRLGLPHDRPAAALSSGMRQRLRWAFALLHRPAVLLLDEPLQNLDAPGRRDVLALLQEHLETGLAVVANPESVDVPGVERHLELAG